GAMMAGSSAKCSSGICDDACAATATTTSARIDAAPADKCPGISMCPPWRCCSPYAVRPAAPPMERDSITSWTCARLLHVARSPSPPAIRSVLESEPVCVQVRGEALPVLPQCLRVEARGRHLRGVPQLHEWMAQEIVGGAAAGIGDLLAVYADAIHADDV